MKVSLLTLVLVAAIAGAGCARENAPDVSQQIVEKRLSLTAVEGTFAVGFLKGTLSDLSVVQRVNAETGEVVSPPQLTGTLTVENVSEDQAARVIAGTVGYLDGAGAKIPLSEGRGEPALQIYGYGGDRLDPGGTATHRLDLPFPAAAFGDTSLAAMRVSLTYIPMPYRQATGRIAVSVAPQR